MPAVEIPLPPRQNEVIGPLTAPVTAPTPHELLSRAVLSGAPIEVVERLSQLVERWDDRRRRAAFEAAMARVRARGVPLIKKSRRVDYTTAKGRTNYEYEDFADVAKVADDEFPKEGITYRFRLSQHGDKVTVTCVIAYGPPDDDEGGYFEENSLSATADSSGNKNDIQAVGSTVTYLQRYTLKAALGLAAVDDDAQSAGGKRLTVEQAAILYDLLRQTGIPHETFCKVMKTSHIELLPEAKFAEAEQRLKNKLPKGDTDAAG